VSQVRHATIAKIIAHTPVTSRPAPGPVVLRTRQQVLQLFTGLEVLEPGLVPTSEWRPGTDHQASAPSAAWAGVARTT
jgi:hypothetical protein